MGVGGILMNLAKIKKIAKYTTNILAIVNALLVGLNPIWNIPYCDKITATFSVVMAVIGTYLLGDKGYNLLKSK